MPVHCPQTLYFSIKSAVFDVPSANVRGMFAMDRLEGRIDAASKSEILGGTRAWRIIRLYTTQPTRR